MSILDLEDRAYTVKELAALGYNRMRLSRLVREGRLQSDLRGTYRLPFDGENSERASWAARSVAVPGCVFFLYSAAVYHGISENLGARAYVGIPDRRRSPPDVEYFTWRDPANFEIGIDTLRVGVTDVLVTSPARTLVDFFRYSHLGPGQNNPRMKKPVDPDALNDVVIRYMQTFGKPDIKVHRIAKEFGVQEALRNYLGILQAARPDLWLPPARQTP